MSRITNDFSESIYLKFHKCLSWRARYILHKRQPDNNVYTSEFVVTLDQMLCTAILNWFPLIIRSVDVFFSLFLPTESQWVLFCWSVAKVRHSASIHSMHHIRWHASKMAPPRKKKKTSKHEKKKSLAERGKKSAESKGVWTGSRRKFALAAHWREEPYKSDNRDRGTRMRVSFVSPGKTKYWSQKSVEKALVSRNLADCLYDKSASSTEGNTDPDDSEDCPSSGEDTKCKQFELDGLEVELERRLFVCESTQLMDMVEQINALSKCPTPECSGE